MRRQSSHSSQMRRGKLTSHWIPPVGTALWFLWGWVSATENLSSGVGWDPWKRKNKTVVKSTRVTFLLKLCKMKSHRDFKMTFQHIILNIHYFKQSAISSGDNSFSRYASSLASLDPNCIATLCLCAWKGTYNPSRDKNTHPGESEGDDLHWLKPFYSESNSFLEIKAKNDVMSCDQEQEVQVDYILSQKKLSSEEDHIDFYYLVSTEESWPSGQGYAYWHFPIFSQHRGTQRKGKATPRQSVCDFCSAQTHACFPLPGPAPLPSCIALLCFAIHALT